MIAYCDNSGTVSRIESLLHVTSEQIMRLTPARIKQWLITGTSQIKIHIAAAHQRAKLQTTDIRNFFTRKASRDKDSLKPP